MGVESSATGLSKSFGRVQSPSSIILYKQCPRKYYYRYIEQIPELPSIHLIRGKIVHKVLEDIYDLHTDPIPEENFLITLKVVLQEHFKNEWLANADKLARLELSENELNNYYEETKVMINNFFFYIRDKIEELTSKGISNKEAFQIIKPLREVELKSDIHHIRGFVDAIHNKDEKTVIIDYKTSKRFDITEDYRLQLAVYSLLFEERFHTPEEVGVFFLKHGKELRLKVNPEMINWAREECHNVHMNTQSKNIKDYPMRPGPLCKWSTGKCPYYELCFKDES